MENICEKCCKRMMYRGFTVFTFPASRTAQHLWLTPLTTITLIHLRSHLACINRPHPVPQAIKAKISH